MQIASLDTSYMLGYVKNHLVKAQSAQTHSVAVAVSTKKRNEDAAAITKTRRSEVSKSSAMLATRIHGVADSTRRNEVGGDTSSSTCPTMSGALLLQNRYSVLRV
ncbi:hypothetical protein EUGRSUZ_E00057 [Eucalyptus grandis]|uniref:Uncharacterized protein n=2 Tax=Eucalyptus grandis TaxID=71139 RepID=A0ACC3KQJ6_EUCGR|nr:hypothetical protein EUGRSUZ_E00057 [Eucalyptus grandis]